MAEPTNVQVRDPASEQQGVTKNGDPILNVLDEIARLNERKRADYAASNDIFSNFKEAAFFSGLRSPGQSVEALIGTKDARLRQLLWQRSSGDTPRNESVRDSLLDRAVYCVIALAMYDQGLYDDGAWGGIKRENR